MAEKPASERTEQPTHRKLQKARQKGNLPQSEELTAIVSLVVLVAAVALSGPNLLEYFKAQVEHEANRQVYEQNVFGKAIDWNTMSNREIAEIMGVTKRQVSKIRKYNRSVSRES